MAGPVVIAYDGSEAARRAISVAAELLGVRRAVVVHVHLQPAPVPAPAVAGGDPAADDDPPDDGAERHARRVAEEGAEVARSAGFEAEAQYRFGRATTGIWRAILDVAEASDASAIVAGRRGLSRLERVILGSVAQGLVNHAPVPVLVVPAPVR